MSLQCIIQNCQEHGYAISTFMDQKFPFFIGLYQEATKGIKYPFQMVFKAGREIEYVLDVFQNLFGETPRNKETRTHGNNRRRIRFHSKYINSVIDLLTDNGNNPPYQLLTSQIKKLEYLRGFMYRGACIAYGVITIKRSTTQRVRPQLLLHGENKLDLLAKIQALLDEFTIKARNMKAGIGIFDMKSLRSVLQLNLLSPTNAETLSETLHRLEVIRRTEYYGLRGNRMPTPIKS